MGIACKYHIYINLSKVHIAKVCQSKHSPRCMPAAVVPQHHDDQVFNGYHINSSIRTGERVSLPSPLLLVPAALRYLATFIGLLLPIHL